MANSAILKKTKLVHSAIQFKAGQWKGGLDQNFVLTTLQYTDARTCAVTLGLPSRSPPIQDPNRKGVALRGKSRPVCFLRALLIRRR
jgi:hypothetical protein